jgi:hypothetical protein
MQFRHLCTPYSHAMTFSIDSLEPFLGVWRGGGDIAPNPWGGAGPCRGSWSFRVDAARKAVIHDYEENRADGSAFAGHGVWCADGDDLLWFWFDSYGFPPLEPSRGGWRNGRLELTKSTPRGHGRSTWTCDGRRLSYLVEAKPLNEAAFARVMSGVFDRVSGF